jgi:hypothetical protein
MLKYSQFLVYFKTPASKQKFILQHALYEDYSSDHSATSNADGGFLKNIYIRPLVLFTPTYLIHEQAQT